jgi:hypothetical protein
MLYWAKIKLVASIVAAVLLTGGAVGTYVAVAQTGTTTHTSTTTPPIAKGAVTAVTNSSVTFTYGGVVTTVTVDASTVFKLGGNAATLADVKVGQNGYAFGTAGQPATEIRLYTPTPPTSSPTTHPATAPGVTGLLTAIGADTLTIKTANGETAVTLNAGTVIKISGNAATLADLKTGMYIYALGAKGQPATEIRAYPPKPATTQTSPPATTISAFGTVTDITGSIVTLATQTATIKVSFDTATVFNINGNKSAGPSDLKVGMHMAAIGDLSKPAKEIRAYTPPATTAH